MNFSLHRGFHATIAGAALIACFFGAAAATAGISPLPTGVPDFSSGNMGWAAASFDFLPPDSGPGPVKNDPGFPFCRNNQGCTVMPRMADPHSPILQPWAQAAVNKWNDDIQKGKQAFAAQSRCWPGGVPNILTYTAEPTYFLQTPSEVTIIYERGPNIRHVYMYVPHSPNPAPSWLGESVGHYEGNTLVIDTIGLNDKTFVDNYRTPHTTRLHVIERYTIAPDHKSMRATIEVDDPGTFTSKWSAAQRFILHTTPISEAENVCAENNDANYFHEDEVPIPQSTTPDF
ncbi:MAG TPA: hypothetical protein VFW28_20355 [Micropepsaceae bacterium]|nr:hypothetical protein [Micropepsaceae bacterium]